MRLPRIGPFEPASAAAGIAAAGALLLIAGFFVGATEVNGTVAATLAIAGLALGAVAAGTFIAAVINAHLSSGTDKPEETR
jgi:hypothetical protein